MEDIREIFAYERETIFEGELWGFIYGFEFYDDDRELLYGLNNSYIFNGNIQHQSYFLEDD